MAVRNRLITSLVTTYLRPSLSPDHPIKTGAPCGPLPMGNTRGWMTSARVLDHNCSVLFWKPAAEYFYMQSKINTFPTCSVHAFTPLSGLFIHPSISPPTL